MSTETSTNNRKFEEALQLLNEAAREKKDEIARLLTDRFDHLKDAVSQGRERASEVFEEVDIKVKKNPWPYIGGAAFGALLLGYILGSQKK